MTGIQVNRYLMRGSDSSQMFGGILMNSKNSQKLNKIHQCVGDQKFKELLELLSGDTVYFSPSGDRISRNAKIQKDYDQMIRQGMKSGTAVEKLSKMYDLAKPTIYTVITVYEL